MLVIIFLFDYNRKSTMSEIKVRTASIADIRAIRELMLQLYDYYGISFNEKRFEWGIKKRLKDRLQREV